jgi:DNA-binding CsgD family transcriptional regulator
MFREQRVLADIIASIGERDFSERTMDALSHFTDFSRSALISHGRDGKSQILFENLSKMGCGTGVRNYVRTTRRINPMLLCGRRGAVRARDFMTVEACPDDDISSHIVPSREEELGYRTIGWPERHEEIGLYFDDGDCVIELGFYRERSRSTAPVATLRALDSLCVPIAAAFARHGGLARYGSSTASTGRPDRLTKREEQVGDLLLAGYSSEAIALRLGISRHTVRDHRKHIFRKLRISSLAEFFAITRHPSSGGWRNAS